MTARRAALWTAVALLLSGCAALCLAHVSTDRPATIALPPVRGDAARVCPTPEPPNGAVAVNTADADELCALFGIGESLAAEIIAERERNGAFYLPEDLLSVRGIGPKKLAGFWHQLDLQP